MDNASAPKPAHTPGPWPNETKTQWAMRVGLVKPTEEGKAPSLSLAEMIVLDRAYHMADEWAARNSGDQETSRLKIKQACELVNEAGEIINGLEAERDRLKALNAELVKALEVIGEYLQDRDAGDLLAECQLQQVRAALALNADAVKS